MPAGASETIHLERYAPDAKALVAAAQALADERKHAQVEPIHLLARAVDRDPGVAEVFRKAGADPAEVKTEAEGALGRMAKTSGALAYLSGAMLQLLGRAEKEAAASAVGVEQLLNALSQEIRGPAAAVLQAFAIGPGSLRPHMAALHSVPRGSSGSVSGAAAAAGEGAKRFTRDLVARARSGVADPVIGRDVELRRVLQVLERRQKNHPLLVGEPGVGKSAIVGALALRMAQGDVPGNLARVPLLELETGALLAGARLRGEIEDRVRQVLASLGADNGGERKSDLTAGLGGERDDAILYIDNIDALFGQGAAGSAVGELLKPMLSRGEVRLLATATPDGVRRIEERDPGLLRRFTVLDISPPTVEQAIEIVRGIATRYEAHHQVHIGDPAVVSCVELAKRYVRDRALPDSAIDLLDEASARKRVEAFGVPAEVDRAIRRLSSIKAQLTAVADDTDTMSVRTRKKLESELAELEPQVASMRGKVDAQRGARAAFAALRAEVVRLEKERSEASEKQDFARLGEIEHVSLPEAKRKLDAAEKAHPAGESGQAAEASAALPTVDEEDVARVLGEWTGIPVAKMLESDTEKLLKMEERLSERVVGQAEAVRAVARAVRRGRVGLRDPGKPIGSFLFLGPSGVGKTELGKALAEFLFDDEQALTRLDMSEFMEKHMAQRLVGAPPGYVDSEEGGFLTEAVRRRPYSVLLFDEVEKAHADVWNLLLQVLDDGRLTDGRGRTADFSNTVVIMTSNIGSKRILETDPKLFESPEGREALGDVIQSELTTFLRPEFLNRIDDVILFHPLTKVDLRGIVKIQLRRLEALLESRELSLSLTDAAQAALVDFGYEPAFGARPLKRAILKRLQDPLAEAILSGAFPNGSVVQVDAKDGELVLSLAPATGTASAASAG